MKTVIVLLVITAVIYAAMFISACVKSGKFFKFLIISVISGIGAFVLVNLLSYFTGISIPANLWTVSASAVLGVPGVIGLLAANLLL